MSEFCVEVHRKTEEGWYIEERVYVEANLGFIYLGEESDDYMVYHLEFQF